MTNPVTWGGALLARLPREYRLAVLVGSVVFLTFAGAMRLDGFGPARTTERADSIAAAQGDSIAAMIRQVRANTERLDMIEPVFAYIGCRAVAEDTNTNPALCRSHLSLDLRAYLLDPSGAQP